MIFDVPKTEALRAIGAATVMLGASAFCTRLPEMIYQVMGWFGVVFFGWALLTIVRRLKLCGPALKIDAYGIHDYRNDVVILWTEIQAMQIIAHNGPFLALGVDEPEQVLQETGWRVTAWSVLSRVNRKAGWHALYVGFHDLTPGIDAVWSHIQTLNPSCLNDEAG